MKAMKNLLLSLIVACAVAVAGEAIKPETLKANFVDGEVNGVAVRFCDVRKAPFIVTGFPFCRTRTSH